MQNTDRNKPQGSQPDSQNHGDVYEIKIQGYLNDHWKQWFEGMGVSHVTNGGSRRESTLLTGMIVDQPALHGLLAKIRDLNLELISVKKIDLEMSKAGKPDRLSSSKKIRVAVNGYGLIGKRVADAVTLQDDMELAGVADIVSDWRIRVAAQRPYPVYAATEQVAREMEAAGIPVAGSLDELISRVDIVVDATPKKVAPASLERYRKAGIKSIFQGGEEHSLTGHSFVAQVNYASALDRESTRVVSCDTASIVRTLGALKAAGLLGKARGVLVRRATDPWESDHSGSMNTVVPESTIPSHQGPDAQTIIPDLDVVTTAVVASHTNCHLHSWCVELARPASREEVLAAFRAAPRIAFLRAAEGIIALNSTLELMSDLGRPRGDMWEVGLWEDGLAVRGDELFYNYQVYNQAIVVPETIDAIRALTGIEREASVSIQKTDRSLGIKHELMERDGSVEEACLS
jgi:glyceraldehyde-3-phosphate dehydrogenase (NAD(P))